MSNVRLSLIGTSQGGREKEVRRLLNSLVGYFDSLEIIFVDQTSSDHLQTIFNDFFGVVNFKLLKSQPCPLSVARNIALDYASGEVIGFCDDDAYYNNDILAELVGGLERGAVISFPVRDGVTGKSYASRSYPAKFKKLNYLGVIKYSLSVGTFISLRSLDDRSHIRFDERLGAGTNLGGSEETELFFRLIKYGYQAYFSDKASVFHDDDFCGSDILPKKYQMYAIGYAVVIKKYMLSSHGLLMLEVVRVVVRSCAGLLFSSKRKVCASRLKGFFSGIFFRSLS